ncbi:SDR family NAD(P)-dependent oxidoreductase [Georgenia thermotolerans]|uniref:SDR family NAD(P)-dependent oxidoreductase n=1 Tax=Georgenia thermotolerans TaxID=527326 RepID=A0A7J5UUY2_9MICO|nr:SDR family oxidoreductase [Georgenia thermotolerans]KAE8766105.1 SDR family NAD(P)-dependent oxidoreductase [Georgenia thermotolerans]
MKTSFDSTGDVVLVTGGANGIGAALARAVGAAGGQAVVLDVAHSDALVGAPGVSQLRVDVADRDAVHGAVDAVVAEHGHVTGLVAGAAIQPRTAVADMDPDEWRKVLGVNLDGVVWACQAVLPSMVARRDGSIVLFTSGLAHMGRAEASAYAASKGALIPFAKSLAAEVAEHRVRVNVLAPGVVDTPQFRAANPDGAEREHWARTTGIGTPEDVVGPLLFLLSDAATMTGSTLSRDRSYPKE